MKRIRLVAIVLSILVASGLAAAQDAGSQIVGMWKYVSNVQVETVRSW